MTSRGTSEARSQRRIDRRMAVDPDRPARRLRALPAGKPAGGGDAFPGPADRRHQLLPRSRGLCSAAGTGHPWPVRPVPGRQRAHLGAGLLDRRRSLFPRHPAAGISGRGEAELLRSRSLPPTSTPRRSNEPAPASIPTASPPTSRRSGWPATSPRRTAPTASARASATWWSLPSKTCSKTRPFRGST